LSLFIDLSAMPDASHTHSLGIVVDDVDDTVIPDADTPEISIAAQFPRAGGPGLVAKPSIFGTSRAMSWLLRASSSFRADGLMSMTYSATQSHALDEVGLDGVEGNASLLAPSLGNQAVAKILLKRPVFAQVDLDGHLTPLFIGQKMNPGHTGPLFHPMPSSEDRVFNVSYPASASPCLRVSVLNEYRESLRKAIELGVLVQMGDSPAPSPASISSNANISSVHDLPKGIFQGKSASAAIKLYLHAMKKKQTNKEIVSALKEGGMESTGKFDVFVAGALFRLKETGEVLRFKDGWGLAERYPQHLRNRLSQEPKPPKRAKIKRGKRAGTSKWKINEPGVPGLEQRIEMVLKSNETKGFSANEIASILHVEKATALPLALGRLAAKSKAEKCEDGRYRYRAEKLKAV